MVVAELGESLSRAMEQIRNETVVVDEKVLKEFLEEITGALLRSDVQFKLARDMEYKVKNIVNLEQENKRGILQQAIFSELCKMVDGGKPSFTPQKGKASVIMFVGLPGSGKSTTCAKYAHYHSIKGWKPALVCADTATFHQLKQIATDANIPFYGSCTEADPVKIAVEGIERFKKENCDLIVVDTCDFTLFEEMRQAFEATKPDLVIFVMDSSIGRAAFEQAQAFQQSISVGAVILTKMDGHAKGAGALTAVAAAKSPVIFIGAGDNMDDDFKVFDAKQFVGRLLGMGNWSGLMDKLHDIVPTDPRQDLWQKLNHLKFTPRIMYERDQFMLKNNPFRQLSTKCPGADRHWERWDAKTKKYVHMMDWMTNEELDNPEVMNESRIKRIAQESGHQVQEVTEMMESYEYEAEYNEVSRMRNKLTARRSSFRYMRAQQHTSKVVAPQLLGDSQNPMQQMTSAEKMMGRSCQELPTELDAPQAVKEALHSGEHDATCVVVDIIPPANSVQPATPRKKPNKLRPFTSWRKLWDSVDKLSAEGFAMLAKRDEEDVLMLAERKFWPGLHGILAPTICLKRFFMLVLLFCGLYHLVSGALTRLI